MLSPNLAIYHADCDPQEQSCTPLLGWLSSTTFKLMLISSKFEKSYQFMNRKNEDSPLNSLLKNCYEIFFFVLEINKWENGAELIKLVSLVSSKTSCSKTVKLLFFNIQIRSLNLFTHFLFCFLNSVLNFKVGENFKDNGRASGL